VRSFFCETCLADADEAWLDADEAAHAVRVLRLRPGDEVRLLDGAGTRAAARLVEVAGNGRRARVRCHIESRERWQAPRRRLHLLVAPPRAKLMAQVIQDASELGVWRLTPVLCAFSVARPEGPGAQPHWRAEAVAALKQSGNPFLPILEETQPFAAALARTPAGCGLCGDAAGASADMALAGLSAGAGDLPLWIGPEGGFSPAERAALAEHGCRTVTAGTWTLRVETAVTALVARILERGGDDFRCHPAE
jgi:16S rRNA (uracil1498-N3)-methyltransferase